MINKIPNSKQQSGFRKIRILEFWNDLGLLLGVWCLILSFSVRIFLFPFLLIFHIDSIFADFLLQVLAEHLGFARGFGDIPVALLQDLGDVESFEFFFGFTERSAHPALLSGRATGHPVQEFFGKIRNLDRVSLRPWKEHIR